MSRYRQPADEKVAALRTLLPLLYVHLASLERLMQPYGYEREVKDQRPPRAMWQLLDCEGQCSTLHPGSCPYEHECKGEAWESMWNHLRRAWRLDLVKRALMVLAMEHPRMALAIEVTYVHPDEGTEKAVNRTLKGQRDQLAQAGLEWMAAGPLLDVALMPFVPFAREDAKRTWTQRVVELRTREGLSQRDIQRRLGGYCNRIAKICAAIATPPHGALRRRS